MSALVGNPDQDACLVDKSVTLEIGRNFLCLATCTLSQIGCKETQTSTLFKVRSVSLPYNHQVQRTIYLKEGRGESLTQFKVAFIKLPSLYDQAHTFVFPLLK